MNILSVRNERGFVLVTALLALLILMAIATLIYTVTTKDIRVSLRQVGEQKAFVAAESCLHILTAGLNTNAGIAANTIASGIQIDSTNDPDSVCTINSVAPPAGVPVSKPLAGFEVGGSNNKNWGQSISTMRVTGSNTRFNTNVSIDTGVGFGPIEISTGQPAAGG